MQITSSAFQNDQFIPAAYTCDGANLIPPLRFSAVPSETKSLVLIVDDPDSPSGNWSHWLVWNISPQTSEIEEGRPPTGASQGVTSFGESLYGGPCPHSGTHRYFFKLYALDIILDLPATTDKKQLEEAIAGHVLDQNQLMGRYRRP